MIYDLSVIIPARNEEFLVNTVEDICKNIEGKTEVIVILDGYLPDPPLVVDSRVTIIYNPEAVGQRAAQNQGVKISRAKYIMKVDAHCCFDKGFDVKMMAAMEGHDDWTMVPKMYNFHIFDWVCKKCGDRQYQGPLPTECPKCDNIDNFEKLIVWQPRLNRESECYRFDVTLHFQYHGDWKKKPEFQEGLTESMSVQGSCFMLTRAKYWELNICDESWGSWGQQGTEVACKTWLSGGRVVINKKTWYAHLFRTRSGFGFPYPLSGNQVEYARQRSRDLFLNNTWDKQIYPLSWLIDKFAPLDWHEAKNKAILDEVRDKGEEFYKRKSGKTWGVVYYTDNRLDPEILTKCQNQLKKAVGNHKIVSVSLMPLNFGNNIVMQLERGYLTLAKQILAGLEALDTDYVFLAEHDVIYRSEHFEFVPPDDNHYFYNMNVWHVRTSDGHAVYYDCKQQAELCANRELLVKHYRERVRRIEAEGFHQAMGFEPGSHNRPERIDDIKAESWRSTWPNIDLRHDKNTTPSRWSPDEFRDKKNCENWQENDNVPGWGHFRYFWKKLKN